MDRPHVLCKSASVRESPTTAPTDVRLRSGMSELVGAQSLFRFERFAALCAHMAGCWIGLVDYLVSVEGRRSLKRLATRAAGECSLTRVYR